MTCRAFIEIACTRRLKHMRYQTRSSGDVVKQLRCEYNFIQCNIRAESLEKV